MCKTLQITYNQGHLQQLKDNFKNTNAHEMASWICGLDISISLKSEWIPETLKNLNDH